MYLDRHPTALTTEEKLTMVRWERGCNTQKSGYHDQRLKTMLRCPLKECDFKIINSRSLSQNVGIHYREFHNHPGHKYRVHFTLRGEEGVQEHPQEEQTVAKSTSEGDKSNEKLTGPRKRNNPGRPGRVWAPAGTAKYTQPSIRTAMLRHRVRQQTNSTNQSGEEGA